jgi:hypothetical protein
MFNSHDIAVIEQALQAAIAMDVEGNHLHKYREVLKKMHNSTKNFSGQNQDILDADQDGFRYDYDDSADLF